MTSDVDPFDEGGVASGRLDDIGRRGVDRATLDGQLKATQPPSGRLGVVQVASIDEGPVGASDGQIVDVGEGRRLGAEMQFETVEPEVGGDEGRGHAARPSAGFAGENFLAAAPAANSSRVAKPAATTRAQYSAGMELRWTHARTVFSFPFKARAS